MMNVKDIKVELPDEFPLGSLASRLTIIWAGNSKIRMSVDAKSDFSENESSSTPSPTSLVHQNPLDALCKQTSSTSSTSSAIEQQDAAAWTNYSTMMPFWNPQPLKDKMLQPSFDPQLYSRWHQMGDASGFYSHPDLYSSFGLPQMAAAPPAQLQPNSANVGVESEVKPPLSNGSSSDGTGSMYPSPSDMNAFPSTSAATPSTAAVAATNYQQMAAAATCYQQGWPFLDYQQHLPWKMSLSGKDHRRSLSGGSNHLKLPTGPGTNNIRVRTADKYRMVYSDHQRLELEKEFHMSAFINSDRKSYLSTELNLTERQIKIWFQNRRAKDRRDKQKAPRLM